MYFRLIVSLLSIVCLGQTGWSQRAFPVKVNNKWGLIDAEGRVILEPVYDAIGEFKQFGYAIMQRQGAVGLLGDGGQEVLPPRYEDIKVLDSTLVAVMDQGDWMVINLTGRTILHKGYQRVQILRSGYLAYMRSGKWGLVDAYGNEIAAPRYDEIQNESERFFLTIAANKLGLLSITGREILGNVADEIHVLSDSLIFYRQGRFWGAVDQLGLERIPVRFASFQRLGHQFIKLVADNRFFLYSIPCQSLLTKGEYDDFYSFSPRYVIVKQKRRLGLIDWCGQPVLAPRYHEIQSYGAAHFRVNFEGRWGVVGRGDEVVLPLAYDYISPPRGPVCMVKRNNRYGVVNRAGEEVIPTEYARIDLSEGQAKAYRGPAEADGQEALTVFSFTEDGKVAANGQFNNHFQIRVGGKAEAGAVQNDKDGQNEYMLADFEWFYSPEHDRWGLRRLADGSIQIEPKFNYVQVEKSLGFTLVGIQKANYYEFERTTYRFEMMYGLVNNEVGKPITEIDFLDVRFEDFRRGYAVARCVFTNGRHGLIDRTGRIIRRDMAYIGEFSNGAARMSISGRLSGGLKATHSLGYVQDYIEELVALGHTVDYTQYDQLFQQEAHLVCQDCEWGYLDTTGQIIVKPQYSFAQDMVNRTGIVACNGKWGMIDRAGRSLIPCEYDGINFLENTNNRMVRLYVEEPKYGLIDTLGQLTVGAIYEEIGSFAEGRLAVKRGGMWGFVDRAGSEVIPCRFREVQNFSGGLAAVRLGNDWGFINLDGKIVIDFQYRRVGNFSNDLAWVATDKGVGYINPTNNFVITPHYQRAFDFFQGVARVVVDGAFGLIDARGRYVLRPKYGEIGDFNRYGLAIVRYGNDRIRYGVINLQGQQVTQEDYRGISDYREGLAVVKGGNGYGYIDTRGQLVIPCQFSKAGDFSENRAAVQLNGQCGYIDRTGEEIISLQYSRCQDFADGRAVVYRGMKNAGLIDAQGREIVAPSLDRLLTFQEGRGLMRDDKYRFYYITEQNSLYDGYYDRATSFRHGVAVVQINGKWGIINHKGIELIPPKYDSIEGFHNGFAKVKIEGYSGLSNLNGDMLAQPHYEVITYAGDGLFRVEQGDKIGYFDQGGKWVWNLSK